MNSILSIGVCSVLFEREAKTAEYGFGETRIYGSLETMEASRIYHASLLFDHASRVAKWTCDYSITPPHHFRVLPSLPP